MTTTWSTPSSTGAEPPWSASTEHSKTEEDDDRVDENPPEAVASQPDSDTELAKLEDRWRRAVADLDNLRKRYARELDRERTTERSRVAGAWLPIVDNLERAIESCR